VNGNRILITGANGQLGRALLKHPGVAGRWEWIPTDYAELDITSGEAVNEFLEKHQPGAIINCAAYTAVDRAEAEYEKALAVNASGPGNLAIGARRHSIPLIHISTDYVFSGENARPYRESDPPDPRSAYGRSKLEGENAIRSTGGRAIIIRTSWLYSETGKNFFLKMLQLGAIQEEIGVVCDQTGSPTYAGDLASGIIRILEFEAAHPGWPDEPLLFHFSNTGTASWFDFAMQVAETAGLSSRIIPIRSDEYPLPAPRPAFSVMDNRLFRDFFHYDIPYWRSSVECCFEKYQMINP
jgi:dTDP-4-dehydrorhamnose reductase